MQPGTFGKLLTALCGITLAYCVSATHAATLTISANPASVTSGGASTLTWTSTEATSCAASGAWSGVKAKSGSQSVIAPNGLSTYALNCSGPGGSASNSVVIGAGATPPALYALNVSVSGSGTVTSNPSGIACGATCSASYPSGAVVTLSAVAAAGHTFSSWSGACTGTGACTTTLSAARSVTATFSSTSGNAIMVSSAAELTAALQSAVGGETIALASGAYGVFAISNKTYSSTVFVRPQVGATPVFKSFTVTACKKMQIAGLSILPRRMNGDTVGLAVNLSGANEDIIFEKSLISYADDSSGWTAQNWLDYAYDGIAIHGNRMIVRDNLIYNTAFALASSATNSFISRNHINGFRADGMRGQGDYTTFEYNDVRNCVQVDANHADGFQAFTVGSGGVGTGTITGVNLIGNTIIDNENMSNPLKCQLQAIGLFDGTYVDWVIENNLIVTDHYHGISIYGSVNAKIVNNTVIDHNYSNAIRPWIMITTHKNGTPSVGGIIRNNISYSVSPGAGTTSDHNLIVNDALLATVFVDPTNLNFKLKAGSPAIDAGTTLTAPAFDLLGLPRSIPIDLGAYDFQ